MTENGRPYDYSFTQNRELSWLVFNDRVLMEAADEAVPLLERLKFVSIFTSNLDEFFMIRVGSLWDLALLKNQHEDNKSGWLPKEQLDKIYEAVKLLYQKRDEIYGGIKENLGYHDVQCVDIHGLDKKDKKFVQEFFHLNILPMLSPVIIGVHHPCPHFLNKQLYIMATLEESGKKKYGIIPVPMSIPRLLYLPGNTLRYVLLESILKEHLREIFGKFKVLHSVIISVTRNADINPDDEGFEVDEDYRHHMANILKKRKRLAPVRLEYQDEMPREILQFLMAQLNLQEYQCFYSKTPLDMSYAFILAEKLHQTTRNALTYPPFTPQPAAMLLENRPLLPQILKGDILLNFPYETMDGFLKLIKEASVDPEVISIKIAIYRMAKQGKLLKYLCDAAENNKDVVVIMELRARFDEESNIEWAEILEDSGCQIFYGFTGYKVHSKICLITRLGKQGMEYYTQIGTGNYNEKTAKMYTDASLLTANQEIGLDAAMFFKNMAISNLSGDYKHLLVAPYGIKTKLLQLMDEEIEKAKSGISARITFKVNSLTDREILDGLQRASAAGVEVNMIVRGICCILPQIQGKTDNVHVESIVGRYLEHSRFYCFGVGDDSRIYISSADLMTRNMSKRVEIACPILDKSIRDSILFNLSILSSDNVKARRLLPSGQYETKDATGKRYNAQEYFMAEAENSASKRQSLPPEEPTTESQQESEMNRQAALWQEEKRALIEQARRRELLYKAEIDELRNENRRMKHFIYARQGEGYKFISRLFHR